MSQFPTETASGGPNAQSLRGSAPGRTRRLDSPAAPRHQPRAIDVPEVIPRQRNEQASRVLNFVIAALALIIASPVLILLAIGVKLTSRGPILYAQTRVGLDRRWRTTLALHERRLEDLGGQVFTIYKFRTMRVDAERGSGEADPDPVLVAALRERGAHGEQDETEHQPGQRAGDRQRQHGRVEWGQPSRLFGHPARLRPIVAVGVAGVVV